MRAETRYSPSGTSRRPEPMEVIWYVPARLRTSMVSGSSPESRLRNPRVAMLTPSLPGRVFDDPQAILLDCHLEDVVHLRGRAHPVVYHQAEQVRPRFHRLGVRVPGKGIVHNHPP